jgi:hypothetical protein
MNLTKEFGELLSTHNNLFVSFKRQMVILLQLSHGFMKSGVEKLSHYPFGRDQLKKLEEMHH